MVERRCEGGGGLEYVPWAGLEDMMHIQLIVLLWNRKLCEMFVDDPLGESFKSSPFSRRPSELLDKLLDCCARDDISRASLSPGSTLSQFTPCYRTASSPPEVWQYAVVETNC